VAFLLDACKNEALLAHTSEAPHVASPWQDTATVPAGSHTVAIGSQLTAGHCLGPYRIEAILGAGGIGPGLPGR
jgi:hypothetical protein